MKKRQKHNYTSELELKSLLIRIKNKKTNKNLPEDHNSKINRAIKCLGKLNNKKYKYPQYKSRTKKILKKEIIRLSEITNTDKVSYEKFGEIILLMIKNILKRPNFSGYTYRDDFYSDAVHKILKYLHNFDHTMISERSGQAVNAFAYISQIIHNSIVYIINTKNKENKHLKKQIGMENLNHNLQLKTDDLNNQSTYEVEKNIITENIEIKTIKDSLIKEIENLNDLIEKADKVNITYPSDYTISFKEYDKLKPILKGKINIVRNRDGV